MQAREVGDGNGIGGIVGFRDSIHAENNFESVLYLFLFGSPIPADPPFDLEGSKFPNLNSFLLEYEEDGSTSLGDVDTRFLIGGEKKSLDATYIRMVGVDKVSEIACDVRELLCDVHLRRSRDDSVVEDIHGSAIFFNQSKADRRSPRINT